MLIEELKKANIEAMKNKEKDRRAILSVVITRYQLRQVEAKAQGKEIGKSLFAKFLMFLKTISPSS